jgi:hypothetical protein
MAFDRFMIAPLEGGLQNNVRPWLIPDEAYQVCRNAYVFRGRTRKRVGSRYMGNTGTQLNSRLRINVGITDAGGNTIGIVVPGVFPLTQIGQMFSIGTEIFTVVTLVAPFIMLKTGSTVLATFDTTTGTVQFTGATPLTVIYYYPALPVMGFANYQIGAINAQPSFAWDTKFAYQFTSGGWERLTGGADVWTGNDSQFFWTTNWIGIDASQVLLYETNFNIADGIRYWDGLIWTQTNFILDNIGTVMDTALMLFTFKNRLVALHTIEGGNEFVNRARFSKAGNPLAANAWNSDIDGNGDFLDAPTKEPIISAQILKDHLIVFFESSTWELVFTGNQLVPYLWQQLNIELGAESTFSTVPFDDRIVTEGNVGIHACNGYNVQRIDQKIPDEIFNILRENNGIKRVYGIRDYFTQLVYWTFPSNDNGTRYPNRVLVFNYVTGSWAFNDDSITAFGYFNSESAITWGNAFTTWGETTYTWGSAELSDLYKKIIFGNQEGYVLFQEPGVTRNAGALQITNLTVSGTLITLTIIDHNLTTGDYILLENIVGDPLIEALNFSIFQIAEVNKDQILIVAGGVTGVYAGGGTAALVSQVNIVTKQYNFYVKQGKNALVSKVDFMVDKTNTGEITVDYNVSTSPFSMVNQSQATNCIVGNNILETRPYALVPLEQSQTRLWHPVYFQADGEVIQFNLYWTDDQITNPDISLVDFQLHAFVIYAQPISRLQ